MAVEAQVKLITDRVAAGRQLARSNYVDGPGGDFWALVDAAQDETFENRVKGTSLTALDSRLAQGTDWSTSELRTIFENMRAYFRDDLGIAPISNSHFAGWLRTYLPAQSVPGGHWRVPWDCAEALVEALGASDKLPAYCVFPKGTRIDTGNPANAKMHQFGSLDASGVWTVVDGALDSTKIVGAGVWVIALDANDLQAIWRCVCQNGIDYKDIEISWAITQQWSRRLAGAQALAANATVGATTIQVASTANFTVADYILLYKSDAVQEVVQVKALLTGPVRLELETPIVNAYAITVDQAIPLFTNVSLQTRELGTGAAGLYAYPDRIIAL